MGLPLKRCRVRIAIFNDQKLTNYCNLHRCKRVWPEALDEHPHRWQFPAMITTRHHRIQGGMS